MHENLFASDNVGANGARDKIPGVVDDQGSKFLFHGAMPVQIDEGTGNTFDAEVADKMSLSSSSRKPRFTHVVIGWGLVGGSTSTTFAGGNC
jgi:hypothetical protein